MAENSNLEPQTSNLYPLDTERVVVFERIGGGLLKHVFRRPTDEDAREFFRGIQLVIDRSRAKERVDGTKPKRDFYARLAVDAQGYPPVKGHDGALCKFEPPPMERDGKTFRRTWHDLLPLAHRLAAVDELMYCGIGGCGELNPEFETVALEARSYRDGKIVPFTGLHRFEPFTDEDRVQFDYESNRTIVVGGSRSGMTISVPKQNVMLRLYDRKIREVEGYAVNGRPLAGADEIRAQMDPFHKVGALTPLVSEWTLDLKRPGEAEPSDEDLARQMAEAENQPE